MERDGRRVFSSSLQLNKLTGGLSTVISICQGILSPHLLVALPHMDPNYRLPNCLRHSQPLHETAKICRLASIRRHGQASGHKDPVSTTAAIVSRTGSCGMLP